MRYKGKNAFVWTSKAYAHSTRESAGVECEGGERRRRLDVNLNHISEREINQVENIVPQNSGNYDSCK